MRLLLIGLDGTRIDVAVPAALATHPGFAQPDHPSDPRYRAAAPRAEAPAMPALSGEPAAPTLARLLTHGAILPVWMTPPTDSGPGWSALLTGVSHEETGVRDNSFTGHRLAEAPDVLTRIATADPLARTLAACTWEPLVDAAGPGPVIQERPDAQRAGLHRLIQPSPGTEGSVAADREITERVCEVLRGEGAEVIVVHLDAVDEAGHAHGAASAAYREAISGVDAQVGQLVDAVDARVDAHGEDWLVVVVTDHGHRPDGGHGEDEVDVRRSFLLLDRRAPDDAGEGWARRVLSGRPALRAQQVIPLLLDLLGKALT